MAKGRINIIEAIRELKERTPFQPFRIVMTSGDKYQIDDGGKLVEMRTQFFTSIRGPTDSCSCG